MADFICAAWRKRKEGPMQSRRTLVNRCDLEDGHEGDHVDNVLLVNWPDSESEPESRPCNELKALENQTKVQYFTWRTKDGKVLRITEMSDEHLVNTIHHLRRVAEHGHRTGQDTPSYYDHESWVEFPLECFEPSILHEMVFQARARGIQLL
jgi:hypothetical protein